MMISLVTILPLQAQVGKEMKAFRNKDGITVTMLNPSLYSLYKLITLRSPLYVRGTFKNPQAGVKAGPLIARGAVAAALATLVTPAAALLALISPSEGEANQCRTILSQMKK